MPNPNLYKGDKQNFISDCIKTNINENRDPEQAAAICFSMWRSRKKKKGKKKTAADILRELSMRLSFTFLGREPTEIEKKKLEQILGKYPQEELKQLSSLTDKWWYKSSDLMTKNPDQMRLLVMSFYDEVLKDFLKKHTDDTELQEVKKIITDVGDQKQRVHPAFIIRMIRDAIKEEAMEKKAANNVIYFGLFFVPPESDKLFDTSKIGSVLDKKIPDPHVTFAFRPTPDKLPPEELWGEKFDVTITGLGNDGNNQGYKVSIPEELKKYYKNDAVPHITLSVSNVGKPVNTRNLSFENIPNFNVQGILGYFDGTKAVLGKSQK